MIFLSALLLFQELIFYWNIISLFTASSLSIGSILILTAGCMLTAVLAGLLRKPAPGAAAEAAAERASKAASGDSLSVLQIGAALLPAIGSSAFIIYRITACSGAFSAELLIPYLFVFAPVAVIAAMLHRNYLLLYTGKLQQYFLIASAVSFIVFLLRQLVGLSASCGFLFILFEISGFLNLRLLRLNAGNALNTKHIAIHLAALLALSIFCCILSLPALWELLMHLLGLFYRTIIAPVLYYVIYGIIWTLVKIVSVFNPHFEVGANDVGLQTEAGDLGFDSVEAIDPGASPALRIILLLVRIGIIAFLLVFFLRKLIRKKGQTERPRYRSQDVTGTVPHKGLSFFRDSGNSANAVRKAYRRLLRFLKERDPSLKKSSTSLDIMVSGIGFADRSENERIREIYLKNRYTEVSDPDSAEVKEINSLIKKITRS